MDACLTIWVNLDLGIYIQYEKYGGGYREDYASKGDLTRLKEYVRTTHNDLRPVGLYIPFEKAWIAVKDFIESDGGLSKSIEWIANKDLPKDTFPDP